MFPTSSTQDRGIYFCESRPTKNEREVENCRGKTSLGHINDMTPDLAVFDIKGSKVMMMWQREDKGKNKLPKPMEAKMMK